MNGMILSHIPLHPQQLYRFGANVHGHLHSNRVTYNDPAMGEIIDPRYFSVCVEQTDFRPILFEEVVKRIKDQGGTVGFKNGNF